MRSGSAPPGNSTVFKGKMGISATSAARCGVTFKPVDQSLVEAAETAVAHHEYVIAALDFCHHRVRESAQVLDHAGTGAERREGTRHVPLHVGGLVHEHPVR